MLILALLSCKPTPPDPITLPTPGVDGSPAVVISVPSAFDPTSGGLPIVVSSDADGEVRVRVVDQDGAPIWEDESVISDGLAATFTWNGMRSDGSRALPGTWRVETVVYGGTGGVMPVALDTAETRMVRAAFSDVFATDDAGVTALRVPLYWHGDQRLQDVATAISHLESAEDATGLPQSFPAIPDDLYKAGDDAEPVAWRWNSRPILAFTPAVDTVLGATGLADADVSVQIEGWTVISGLPMRPGVQVVVQKDEPLSTSVGVIEGSLDIQFTAADEAGEPIVIGHQGLPVRFYALLDAPGFDQSDVQYSPWVAAIDPALRGISGTAPDHDAVVDALTEWIYNEAGLAYDTTSGASFYVYYVENWDSAHFMFSEFLDREFGTIVNCTDCASILLTYANMVGAHQNYTIILRNFALNQIKAIGGDYFTNCPFGSWGCGFSYHAVTTDDAGATIWDATLALDGDDNPGTTPSSELLVQEIPGDEYLTRLVMSGRATYNYESQGTMQ